MSKAYDVIVIGGSFAGLSAALQLARARRRVLLVDAGQPRNRFAAHAHGFLGQDGKAPHEIVEIAVQQLLRYPTVEIRTGEAATARQVAGKFAVTLADGAEILASRIVLATGVRDELPPILGMQERWGRTVLHCPYCHGYEVAGHALGVLGNNVMSIHQAILIPDWGPTTYFSQGVFEPDADQIAHLAERGVTIERTPVVELLGSATELDAVKLSDGRIVPIHAIFTAPKTHLVSTLASQLGCALVDGPFGPYIQVDDWKRTTVAGVFAAGDAASPMPNATFAAAAGTMAGTAAHGSLVMQRTL